jgi:hypothetical protein
VQVKPFWNTDPSSNWCALSPGSSIMKPLSWNCKPVHMISAKTQDGGCGTYQYFDRSKSPLHNTLLWLENVVALDTFASLLWQRKV